MNMKAEILRHMTPTLSHQASVNWPVLPARSMSRDFRITNSISIGLCRGWYGETQARFFRLSPVGSRHSFLFYPGSEFFLKLRPL